MTSSLAKGFIQAKNYRKGRIGVYGVTIHHMAGNMTAENCARWLAMDTAPIRSCNYAVGSNGVIMALVDENDTSYCSSNQWNDRRMITIEVANDGGANTGWHVSDEAIKSVILLVADIYKRHKIPKVIWLADKSLAQRLDKQNVTIHRWFSATGCPGEYLESQLPLIAVKANKILGTEDQTAQIITSYQSDMNRLFESMKKELIK